MRGEGLSDNNKKFVTSFKDDIYLTWIGSYAMEIGLNGNPWRTVSSAVNWSELSDSIISCSSLTGPPVDPPTGAGELTLCRMFSMTPLMDTNFFILMLDILAKTNYVVFSWRKVTTCEMNSQTEYRLKISVFLIRATFMSELLLSNSFNHF